MANDLYSADLRTISGTELFKSISEFVRVDRPPNDRPREGYLLDYKEDLSERFLQSVAAMANTFGGILLVGVSEDDGRPDQLVGVATAGELKTRVASIIASNLIPCPPFDIAECALPSDTAKKLCAVKVHVTQEVCLLARKGERYPVYVRIEDQSSPADAFQMRALLDRKRQNVNLDSDLSERLRSLQSDLFVTHRIPPSIHRLRSDTWLQIVLCPHHPRALLLDLAKERLFSQLVVKKNPGIEQLVALTQATHEFDRRRDWFEIQFVENEHDYERRWRITSGEGIGFITQTRWDITTAGSWWSLYDLVADIARVASLSKELWNEIGCFGGFRIEAALQVSRLQCSLDPLFYARMNSSADFPFDGRGIVFAKTPQAGGEAKVDLGFGDLGESLPDTVAHVVNQLLRGLGHTCDSDKLRQAVGHLIQWVLRD